MQRARKQLHRAPEARTKAAPPTREAGFSLLELIVVVAIMGILASIAMPNLIQTPTRAREAVLKTNLHTLREVIDQHYGDKGFYPPTLEALAEEGYLRDVPIDPMTGEMEWGVIYDQEGVEDLLEADILEGEGLETAPGVIDVYSLSPETSLDGTPYADW
ncbi:MAG: type II secretion system GspH family protein [Holophagales bacterium]|nr:type II secretion system GspH family protein [Holophagales bacterium]